MSKPQSPWRLRRWPCVGALLLVASACGEEPAEPPASLTSTSAGIEESVATNSGQQYLEVRAEGVTLWFEALVQTLQSPAGRVYRIHGRASLPLAAVSASTLEGPLGVAEALPQQRFRLEITEAELSPLLTGAPVFFELVPVDASGLVSARVELGARFRSLVGASDVIDVDARVRGYLVGGEVAHRTYLTLDSNFAQPSAVGLPTQVPALQAVSDHRYRVEYSSSRLLEANAAGSALIIRAIRGNSTVAELHAHLSLSLERAAIALDLPALAFPPDGCEAAVKGCLDTTPQCIDGDTESCGSAWQVSRCRADVECIGGPVGAPSELPVIGHDPYSGIEEHFPADLVAYLELLYTSDPDWLAGATPLEEALLGIDPQLIEHVTNPADVPGGQDLATYAVVRHPDLVFPGSGAYLWGVYQKEPLALFDIFRQ